MNLSDGPQMISCRSHLIAVALSAGLVFSASARAGEIATAGAALLLGQMSVTLSDGGMFGPYYSNFNSYASAYNPLKSAFSNPADDSAYVPGARAQGYVSFGLIFASSQTIRPDTAGTTSSYASSGFRGWFTLSAGATANFSLPYSVYSTLLHPYGTDEAGAEVMFSVGDVYDLASVQGNDYGGDALHVSYQNKLAGATTVFFSGNAYSLIYTSAIPETPIADVSEPASVALVLAGLGFIGFTARRKKQLVAVSGDRQ